MNKIEYQFEVNSYKEAGDAVQILNEIEGFTVWSNVIRSKHTVFVESNKQISIQKAFEIGVILGRVISKNII